MSRFCEARCPLPIASVDSPQETTGSPRIPYSIDSVTDGYYPGTTVLINELGIQDEAALNEAEALLSYINLKAV